MSCSYPMLQYAPCQTLYKAVVTQEEHWRSLKKLSIETYSLTSHSPVAGSSVRSDAHKHVLQQRSVPNGCTSMGERSPMQFIKSAARIRYLLLCVLDFLFRQRSSPLSA
eukprot:gb/GECG01016370.1/.p1 GENE.gb/GECG01016370.1/~~gb/GECG01016370.1/.p1  ORF type:complete len:109 (+),score=4.19 gb/GECG01016370.1/:1-327(+)